MKKHYNDTTELIRHLFPVIPEIGKNRKRKRTVYNQKKTPLTYIVAGKTLLDEKGSVFSESLETLPLKVSEKATDHYIVKILSSLTEYNEALKDLSNVLKPFRSKTHTAGSVDQYLEMRFCRPIIFSEGWFLKDTNPMRDYTRFISETGYQILQRW